jgi:predicted enzyme related to lactoylglutathione lyase
MLQFTLLIALIAGDNTKYLKLYSTLRLRLITFTRSTNFITMITLAHSRIKKMSPQLLVTNLEHSITFYIQMLGFELEFRYEDFYAGIIKDGCSIHLKRGHFSMDERKSKRENNDLDVVFSVDEVDALYEECVKKGIDIIQPLSNRPYGREFYIADPDGYIFAFLEEA